MKRHPRAYTWCLFSGCLFGGGLEAVCVCRKYTYIKTNMYININIYIYIHIIYIYVYVLLEGEARMGSENLATSSGPPTRSPQPPPCRKVTVLGLGSPPPPPKKKKK